MNNILPLRIGDPRAVLPREAFINSPPIYPFDNLLNNKELVISSIASGVRHRRIKDFARLMRGEWDSF